MFRNPDISLDELPRVADLEWQGLHVRYALQLQAGSSLFLLLIGIGGTIIRLIPGVLLPPWYLLWLLLLVAAVPILTWPRIAVARRGYALREHDIVYRSGVFWRQVTAVPFNRIQHVETSSTPFDRRFGTATLQLFTAGGSGGDLRINGLPAATAERLRVFILGKAGGDIEQG